MTPLEEWKHAVWYSITVTVVIFLVIYTLVYLDIL